MNPRVSIPILLLVVCGFTFLAPQAAFAAGTLSGVQVDNYATVTYEVSTIPQDTVWSDTASFVVDNKINLNVVCLDGGPVEVIPGSNNQILSFRVTNLGNTVQDYSLASFAAGAAVLFGVTDNFDATTNNIFVDGNGNNTYELTDNGSYIDELAPDDSVTVFILSDIPSTQVDDDGSIHDLWVRTAQGGNAGTEGSVIASDDAAASDIAMTVQTVFCDTLGTYGSDADNDGSFSARCVYEVETATLDVNKTSGVVSDPVNGVTNPKAIPGATIRFTIVVSNLGDTESADTIEVVDAIPANTTFVPGSLTLNSGVLTDNVAADDAGDYNLTNAGAITVDVGTVTAGGLATVTFDVTID
ncbi:MAG: DUF11 domain-containing protein [Candidatus Eisenbacteria bacterium]|uniref:DUF11 domain-containing protein n=1 Tax=Eiseniibacteriota bacterium TaxID=2212470 RepID=A0A7Y2E973_UNCEI|nr:DUF11 domain-containing protein [Candidatus Eisenbacteria bacterium]